MKKKQKVVKKYSEAEIAAIHQFTGMHYSEGQDVQAVCIGMALEQHEWDNIKEDCSWLSDYEVSEIEDYLSTPLTSMK